MYIYNYIYIFTNYIRIFVFYYIRILLYKYIFILYTINKIKNV